MKRFNFFKYTTIANKVHTPYFDYWFFNKLTQGEAPTEPVEGEGTEFTLTPTSNKKLAVVTPKGDTSQNTSPSPDYPQDVNVVTGTQTVTITNGDDVQTYEVHLTSDNLFDRSSASENYSYRWNNGELYATTESVASDYIAVSEGETMQMNYNAQVLFYDSNRVYLGALSNDGVTLSKTGGGRLNHFTAPSGQNIAFVKFGFRPADNNSENMLNKDIMVNKGADLLPYTPYYNYELCKIGTYQDYIYQSGDDWYVQKNVGKLILKGEPDEYWQKLNLAFQTTATEGKGSHINTAYSDNFNFYPVQTAITSNIGNGQFGWNTNNLLTIRNDACEDVTAFKTWLQSHNTSIYFNLATPTDTKITDTTLLSNLNTLLTNGYLKKGTNTIQTTATGTNLPTIIYIKTN